MGGFLLTKPSFQYRFSHTLNQVDKFVILSKRNNNLVQVKKSIDDNLDRNPKSFSYDLSIQEILSSMEIKKDDYYWADSISPDNNCEIHLKRATDSRFVSLIQIY